MRANVFGRKSQCPHQTPSLVCVDTDKGPQLGDSFVMQTVREFGDQDEADDHEPGITSAARRYSIMF